MSAVLRLSGAVAETFGETDLPVSFGPAATADVRVPGPAGAEVLVQIDCLDGIWFVQRLSGGEGLTRNGEALTRSEKLADGDVLALHDSRLTCRLNGAELDIETDFTGSAYRTAAPVAGGDEAQAGEEAIVAAQFRRSREAAAQAPPRASRWRYAVLAGVVVLAALGGLLFTSQSLRIETSPANADLVRIDGGWLQLKLGERYLLRPGNYDLTVASAGYYPAERRVELSRREPLTVRLELEPRPGALAVLTNAPAGATITLDGETLGTAPLLIGGLTRGSYAIGVDAEGYLPFVDSVTVPGLNQTKTLAVELVPATARVAVTSEPAGADVFVGERKLGTTPAIVAVPEGRQTLNLLLDGYKPADVDVAVLANTDVALDTVVLEDADGVLSVRTRPSGANVTVDGRYRGQTPVELALAPGEEYVIALSKAGYGRTSRRVRLGAAEGQILDVDLRARLGRIELSVTPADAVVLVNGRERGRGTQTLELPASPQRIEVRRDGHETWRETITPRPGFTQRVTARLRTLDQARIAAIEQKLTSSQGQVLRYVEPGTFRMGASRREPGRRANETLRNVRLTRPYYIGTREITNQEFQQFQANHDSGADVAVSLAGARNPVANVTWKQAAEFCNWLSEQDGLDPVYEERFGTLVAKQPLPNGYRLPTEAEWVWAARYQAGIGYLKYPWGDDGAPPEDSGNYADQAAAELVATVLPRYDDGFAATAPVASFDPNALGLHDFGGNVAEWVHDYYQVYTPDSSRVWVDPEGPEQAKHNVIRGSGWRHATITELRFSYRDFGSDARPDVGFRIARNAPAP